MPLESMKNRMASQIKGPDGKLPYTSTSQALVKVFKAEGMKGLYTGFLPYYCRCGGHTVSMFLFVQLIRDFYAKSVLQ